MWGNLSIIHTENWIFVAPDHDPEDWVARFEKAPGFPAQEWAERMIALHNSELRARVARRLEQPTPWTQAPFDPRRVPAEDTNPNSSR